MLALVLNFPHLFIIVLFFSKWAKFSQILNKACQDVQVIVL